MISLQQLRVLRAIREHGSLTQAAKALHYGVPTVTHHLDALEAQLDARLVERTTRGARLTPLGDVLCDDGEQILARVEQAERTVTRYRDAGLVTLVVGTFPSIGSRLLPGAFRELQTTADVGVELVEGEPTHLVERLRAGDLHAALIYDLVGDPAFDAPDLELTTLMTERFEVLVARTGDLASAPAVDLTTLSGRGWIGSRNADEASERVLRRAYGALGAEPRVFTRTDDLNMIHGLVSEDLAVALVVPSAIIPTFAVTMRPAVQELGTRRMAFVTRRGRTAPAVDRLRDILASHASRLDTDIR
jgi:molybdate transport repressor ModE-like protein